MLMIKIVKSIAVIFVLAALAGCTSLATAPKAASGDPIIMFVLIDRGIEKSFTNNQTRNRHQVGSWMEKDMAALLKKAGYSPIVVEKRSDFKTAPGAYLLSVKITNYNPGSKAARMTVGLGAGATSANTRYELYGKGAKPILSDDLSVGSGKDWNYVARKLNVLTINAVTAKLSEK